MIIQLLLSAVAIALASYLVPGVAVTGGILTVLVVAIVMAIINLFIKPIIFILTLPINILTLGLFSLVINAVLVLFIGKIVPNFLVNGFWPAFIFAIVLSLINIIFGNTSEDK